MLYLGVCVCVTAPHIEDLVLLPSPVLRLLNLIDDSHLHNEDEYEGTTTCFLFVSFHIFVLLLSFTDFSKLYYSIICLS